MCFEVGWVPAALDYMIDNGTQLDQHQRAALRKLFDRLKTDQGGWCSPVSLPGLPPARGDFFVQGHIGKSKHAAIHFDVDGKRRAIRIKAIWLGYKM